MSTLFPTRSRQVRPAGVFFGLLLLMASARAAEVDDVCVTGFPSPQKPPQNVAPDVVDIQSEAMRPRIHPDLRRWMTEHSWQQGYSAWQQSRQCGSVLRANRVCDVVNATFPSEKKCGGEIDGYHFLVMHRYLLQTFKTLWPQLDAQFSTWKKWPGIEDYPEGVRQQVGAWSDAILRAASDVNAISKANSAEVLRRWPSEGAFGQWLQCGASEGLGVDALYPALLTNAIDIPNDGSLTRPHLMDLYLFWQVHSWVDRAWEKYRRATGKMPDEPQLQAALIQQCRIHQFWTQHSAPTTSAELPNAASLYRNGQLDPAYRGRLARIMGEVREIATSQRGGRYYFRIDPHLMGVSEVWVSVDSLQDAEVFRVGERFLFVGTVGDIQQVAGGEIPLRDRPVSTIFIADAIFTPK